MVNADSEQIIVANQHGLKSKNLNNVKFSYKFGSLENTTKDKNGHFLDKKTSKNIFVKYLRVEKKLLKREITNMN